jgi:hypothetical protein
MNVKNRLTQLEKKVKPGGDLVKVITWGDGDDIRSEKITRAEYLKRYGRKPDPGVTVDWSGADEIDNP